MAFQFYCPQGHLLQGHESQAGQQSQCPLCGSMFVVPGAAAAPPPQPQYAPQPAAPPAAPEPPAPPPEPPKPPEPRIFHIPCPNGHLLETSDDILGQQVLCPYCNVQFELREEDSEEFKRNREEQRRIREEQINEQWVKYSIRAAIGVGVMFGLMLLWLLLIKPFIVPLIFG